MSPLRREDVIGRLINSVGHFDLPYDNEKRFQERLIIVELESGLRFALQQASEIVDPKLNAGRIYPFLLTAPLTPFVDGQTDPNLRSPVNALTLPYGWQCSCGVVLINGFVLHDGFSSWGNGALFYKPDQQTRLAMLDFELPH